MCRTGTEWFLKLQTLSSGLISMYVCWILFIWQCQDLMDPACSAADIVAVCQPESQANLQCRRSGACCVLLSS